jgi:hypothetical protein
MEKADRKRKMRRVPRGYATLGLIGLGWALPVTLIVLIYRAICS